MNEEIKKAFTLPVTIISGVFGFGATIYAIVVIFTSLTIRISIIFSIIILILMGVIINLYLLVRNLYKANTKLKRNNSGLIEAKDNYLKKNTALEVENSKLLENNFLLNNENGQFKDKLFSIMLYIQNLDIDKDEKKIMNTYILGGMDDGKKELESYKDN